jgi:hypothetical protein
MLLLLTNAAAVDHKSMLRIELTCCLLLLLQDECRPKVNVMMRQQQHAIQPQTPQVQGVLVHTLQTQKHHRVADCCCSQVKLNFAQQQTFTQHASGTSTYSSVKAGGAAAIKRNWWGANRPTTRCTHPHPLPTTGTIQPQSSPE